MGMILNRALGVIFAMMVTLARQGQHGSVVELAYTADLKSAGVIYVLPISAGVAELADAGDLKSSALGLVGSSPTAPTSSEFSSAPF